MSQNKKIIEEIVDYIESSIREGFDEAIFIKEFRNKIEKYLSENQ